MAPLKARLPSKSPQPADLLFSVWASQKVPTSNTEGGWSFSLAEYVRHNDMPIYEALERVLRAFQDELMPAESVSEFFDVVGQYEQASGYLFIAPSSSHYLLFINKLN